MAQAPCFLGSLSFVHIFLHVFPRFLAQIRSSVGWTCIFCCSKRGPIVLDDQSQSQESQQSPNALVLGDILYEVCLKIEYPQSQWFSLTYFPH